MLSKILATGCGVLLCIMTQLCPAAVTINCTDVHQRIDGFGASSAHQSSITEAQADLFFSAANGVGLSLLRTCLEPDGTTNEISIMQQALARGARVWSSPFSPPAAWKSNNDANNGGYLLPSHYQDLADYMVQYVNNLKNNYGIDLLGISVQNEPDIAQNYNTCVWQPADVVNFIANYLGPTFQSNGITTKIIAPEICHWAGNGDDYVNAILNDNVANSYTSVIANHAYDGYAKTYSPKPLVKQNCKELWMTEVCGDGSYDPSISDGLYWADVIHNFLCSAEVNSWHYWRIMDLGAGDNQPLVGHSGDPAKRLYVLGNFSKFIRPGFYRIGTSTDFPDGVLVSAYKDSAGVNFVIVAINKNASDVPLDFAFNNFAMATMTPWITSDQYNLEQQAAVDAGTGFSYTLPASSVVSFVGSNSTAVNFRPKSSNGVAAANGRLTSLFGLVDGATLKSLAVYDLSGRCLLRIDTDVNDAVLARISSFKESLHIARIVDSRNVVHSCQYIQK